MQDVIRIRAGRVEDAPAISALLVGLARDFIIGDFGEEGREHFLRELTPEKTAERLRGGYFFLLAEAGGRLAGVAAVRGPSHLYYLFVAREFQRRGLARRLWSQALDEARAAGPVERFTVNASAFAVEAYRRLGFVPTGPRQERFGIVYVPMAFDAGSDQSFVSGTGTVISRAG